MIASCLKTLSLCTSKVNFPVIAFPIKQSEKILILEKENQKLKCEVGYWRSMHNKALVREKKQEQILKKQKGQIRDLRHRVFGKKSEKKNSCKDKSSSEKSISKRPRGQQPGSEGHGRTKRPDLPERIEVAEFNETPVCPCCNKPYIPDEGKDVETGINEVEVQAYIRKIKRPSMKKGCTCKGVPKIITAPMPPKVLPKSPYGISIWEAILLTKFHYCQPTNRILKQYSELGLPISPGTIAGSLKKLKDLFQPVYDALYNHQMTENIFHNDESGWKVFESIEGKIGNKWWLWVSRSASVVFFQIAPGRGADVPMKYFKNIEQQKIIVICDRFSAYKSLARQMPFIILAFCWAHVRRDFLDAAKKYKELEDWSSFWVGKIGKLYHINNQRRKEFNPKLSIQEQSASFTDYHEKLVEKMDAMVEERDAFLDTHKPDGPNSNFLSDVKFKILTSLKNHWEGLIVFVEHPEVPMDNNRAESSIRNPVTGRKNFYGSGSLWSSQLAAMMFSIFQTMALCGLNCNHWLRSYLTACAENHGKAPEDLSPFLPWEMDKNRRNKLSKPPNTL
jgi:transposase